MSKILPYLSIILIATACRPDNQSRSELIEKGELLFKNSGCLMCHSLNGEKNYGPALDSIFMQPQKILRKGKEYTILADRKYIQRSMQYPEYEKLVDFRDKKMPETELSKKEIKCITEYLIYINSNRPK